MSVSGLRCVGAPVRATLGNSAGELQAPLRDSVTRIRKIVPRFRYPVRRRILAHSLHSELRSSISGRRTGCGVSFAPRHTGGGKLGRPREVQHSVHGDSAGEDTQPTRDGVTWMSGPVPSSCGLREHGSIGILGNGSRVAWRAPKSDACGGGDSAKAETAELRVVRHNQSVLSEATCRH